MKDKQKILYVITKSNWGGAQRYVYDLATNLPKDNFEVVVAHGGNGVLKTKLTEKNIRTVSIESLKRDVQIFGELANFFALIKILKNEKPDVLHLNSSKAGGLGALAGRVMNVKKIIFTVHGWAFNENRNIFEKKIIEFLHWITVTLTHITITNSNDLKKQIAHFPLVPKKIFVIHNGIPTMILKDRHEAQEKLMKNNTEKVWVGTISELHKIKGLTYAIEAIINIIKRNKNIIFIIIGEGEEKQSLEKLIAKNNLNKNILLLGHIDNAGEYLKAFDILTLTSISESLGYVLLEAGMAGLPVVASNVGGIPEIIDDKKSGLLVPPKNLEEIEKALMYLIENKEKRMQLGNMLKKKVKEEFTLEQMLKETLQLYKTIQ